MRLSLKNTTNTKNYQKDQQTTKSLDKLYRISTQDNVIDKKEYESLCNNFTEYLEGTLKNKSFL